MLRTKLRQLLDKYNISTYKFAQKVKQTGVRSESWAYKTARGEVGLTSEGIELVIKVLRELTGADIDVHDVVEYRDAESEAASTLARIDPPKSEEHKLLSLLLLAQHSEAVEPLIVYAPPSTSTSERNKPKRYARFALLIGTLFLVVTSFIIGRHSQPLRQVQRQALLSEMPVEPLATPLPIGPEGAVWSTEPKLRVEPVAGATHYTYSVFNSLSRQNVLHERSPEPFFTVPRNALCPAVRYGWKARAHRGEQESSFSSNTDFVIEADHPESALYTSQNTQPEIPVSLEPNGVVTTLTPVLEVEAVEGAVGYGFYMRDLVTDRVHDFEYQSTTPTFEIPTGILSNGGRYRWNARAYNCAGFSLGYSDTMNFEVQLNSADTSDSQP